MELSIGDAELYDEPRLVELPSSDRARDHQMVLDPRPEVGDEVFGDGRPIGVGRGVVGDGRHWVLGEF